jgi:solute carrier family 13 (sodium-dependent dicarboxylate transporter), member 2/3/5
MRVGSPSAEILINSMIPVLNVFNFIFNTKNGRNLIVYTLSVIIMIIFSFIELDPKYPKSPKVLGITLTMGILWAFQTLPLAVTALLPIFLFPLFG